MKQESLLQGITRSIKAKLGIFAGILMLSFFTAYFFNLYMPRFFTAKVVLRIITTDESTQEIFPTLAKAVITEKDFAEKIKKACNFKLNDNSNLETSKIEEWGKATSIISITALNPDRLEKITSEFIRIIIDNIYEKIKENQAFEKNALTKKLDLVNKNIEQVSETLKTFETSKFEVAPELIDSAVSDRKKIELQLNITHLRENISVAETQLKSTPRTKTISYENTPPEADLLKKQLTEEKEKLRLLFRTYKEKHPRVVSCNEKISSLNKKLSKIVSKTFKTISDPFYEKLSQLIKKDKNYLKELENRLNSLNTSETPVLENNSETIPNLSEEHFNAVNKLETFNALKVATLNELEILNIKHKTVTYNIESSKQQKEMYQKSGPNPSISYLICFITALFFSAFLLYTPLSKSNISETQIFTVKKSEPTNQNTIISENIQTPELQTSVIQETISEIEEKPVENLKARNTSGSTKETSKGSYEVLFNSNALIEDSLKFTFPDQATINDGRLFTLNEPESELTKRYKQLAKNIQILVSQTGKRILLPIASKANMGKSTWICNLGILLANEGYKVLIIDTDYTNPSIHKIFDLPNRIGTKDILTGENLVNATQKTEIPDLYVLSSGNKVGIENESDYAEKLNELIKLAKRRSEVIIIDTSLPMENYNLKLISNFSDSPDSQLNLIYLSENSEQEKDTINKFLLDTKSSFTGYVKI